MNHGCRFGGVLTSVAAITAGVATGVAAFNYASTGCPLSSSCSTDKAACSMEKSSTAAVHTVAAKSGGRCSLLAPAVPPAPPTAGRAARTPPRTAARGPPRRPRREQGGTRRERELGSIKSGGAGATRNGQ